MTQTCKLTGKGQEVACALEAQKQHLTKIRESAALRNAEQRTEEPVPGEGVMEIEEDADENSFVSYLSSASLNVKDYMERDHDAFFETALLSIQSDICRNPNAPGYDMKIPPATHWEAMAWHDTEVWRKVEEKELTLLKDMGVYEEVDALPEGRKAIRCRWVYEFKLHKSGEPPMAKARLVTQGFSQIPYMDYNTTFAPVTKSVSVQFVTVYSVLQGWHLNCFDATRAFLWGDLAVIIYMHRPPGLARGFWQLLKLLYGLKQASLIWYRLLRKVLEALGFVCSQFDHAIFIFKHTWQSKMVHCLLTMHVDDGLSGCNSKDFLAFIKSEIKKAFGIKDLGPVKTFLNSQFEWDHATHELWIHQQMYIESLLEEHNLTNCNAVLTPLDPNHPLGNDTDIYPEVENLTKSYQHLVGSLLFLQICTCPDITFAVLTLSQFCFAPLPHHYTAARQVLHYLKGTKTYCLHYGSAKWDQPLLGLSDADWAGDKAGRASISGFVWTMSGGPVSWSAKKQNCIALSSTEAKYVALTRAVQEGMWI